MKRDDMIVMGLVEQEPVTLNGVWDGAFVDRLFHVPPIRTVTLYLESARLFGVERLTLWPMRFECEARVTKADAETWSMVLAIGAVRRVVAPWWMRAAWWTLIVPWRRVCAALEAWR